MNDEAENIRDGNLCQYLPQKNAAAASDNIDSYVEFIVYLEFFEMYCGKCSFYF